MNVRKRTYKFQNIFYDSRKKIISIALIVSVAALFAWIIWQTVKEGNTEFEDKTLWEWMEPFIIPVFLAAGIFLLDKSAKKNEREIGEKHLQKSI